MDKNELIHNLTVKVLDDMKYTNGTSSMKKEERQEYLVNTMLNTYLSVYAVVNNNDKALHEKNKKEGSFLIT